MAQNDFFNEESMDEQSQQTQEETLQIGGKEYTQDQLSRLVGLGEIAEELESKWNTKIDRVYPEFTKTRQEAEELKKQLQSRQESEIAQKAQQGAQLSPEEIRRQAQAQARELGLLTAEEARQTAAEVYEGYKLLDTVSNLIDQQVAAGNPKVTTQELLEYMSREGFRNPEKAYKDMFETQLEQIKEKKLQSLRQPGLVTETTSTAGSKLPQPSRITKDNLDDLVLSTLRGGGQ